MSDLFERCWSAVASTELGMVQIYHGKEAPLRRIMPGDGTIT